MSLIVVNLDVFYFENEKIKSGKVEKGDHLRVSRGDYYHHGIAVNSNEVIHFTGEKESSSGCGIKDAIIKKTSLKSFLNGGILDFVFYRTKSVKSPEETVEIAQSFLNRKVEYSVFNNNCEHFATFCKTGVWHSQQANDIIPKGIAWLEYFIMNFRLP